MQVKNTKSKEHLLVGIVNRVSDFKIIHNELWYRIPVDKADKMLKDRWPPKWIAFYYTSRIKKYPQMILHYGKVLRIDIKSREELFPNEKTNYKTLRKYYKISFEEILTLPKPILGRRWRKIVFIESTYKKFINANEVNDLFDGSRLEDRLWAEFKRNGISAERQEPVKIDDKYYFLDFSIHCKKGKLDIETDGDKWHHNPKGSAKDNIRNNDLTSSGWSVIRFDSHQVNEKMETYCLPTIMTNINKLGGIDFDKTTMKKFLKQNPGAKHPTYFEEYE